MNLVRRAAQQIGAGLSITDLDRMMDAGYSGQPTYTGKLVSPTNALGVAAIWACISVLADDIATLPLLTYRQINSGRELAKDHYLWGLLQQEANAEMSAFRFKQLMQTWVGLWGNAYAEIEISGRGQVVGLWPWRPDRVSIRRDPSGFLEYTYKNREGRKFIVPHTRMLHLRGLSLDGIVGLSPIEAHKQIIGLNMAVTEHGARFFGNGARPLGVLQHPGKMGDKAYESFKQSWAEAHQGLSNAHRVAILEEGMVWKEAGVNMVDAQYAETQNLSDEAIARIYKVPAHRIGLLDRATNNNVEELALEYVQYSLGPLGMNWKQEIEFSLLSPREQQTISVGFNYRNLLRGDHDSMGKFIGVLRQWGIASADEIRDEFLDMNEQPNGIGKSYWQPVNMAPESPYANDPKPAPPASKPNGKPNGAAFRF